VVLHAYHQPVTDGRFEELFMTHEQALTLAKSQRADGWSEADIRTYFTLLVDEFFANWVVTTLRAS
jgi:hypothetical protein